jgi:hypothetical protein
MKTGVGQIRRNSLLSLCILDRALHWPNLAPRSWLR